jgi:hypothetical protein
MKFNEIMGFGLRNWCIIYMKYHKILSLRLTDVAQGQLISNIKYISECDSSGLSI